MTVPNTISGVVRIGDGVVTVFSFPFQVTSAEQVRVADIGDEQQVVDRPGSDYTVSVNVDGAGGEVTFTTPVVDEQKIYIYRATEQTQLVSVSSQQRYDPKVIMAVWDRLTFMIQELNAKTERAVLAAPDTDPQELFTDVLVAQQLATLAANEAAASEDEAASSALAAMASQVAAAASASSAAADAAIASAAVDAVSEASWSSVDAYGAVGDGVHDDRAALVAALNAAAGRKLIGRAGAVYRISNNIEYIGSVSLDLSMAGWFCDTPNVQPFTFRDPGVSDVALLTSDYVAGTLELSITGLPYAPKAGSRIHIVSNARDPGNRDEGSSEAQYRVGEDAIVGEGSTTTLIRLATPLRFLRGIHPTSTAGDEAEVAPYTVAMYARIVALKDEAFCRVKLGRGMFAGGHGDDTSPIWSNGAISVYGYRAPEISGEFLLGYGPAITVVGTYGAKIAYPVFMSLEDDTAQGQYGYGVLDKGWATQVHGMISHNVRHAYTTGADARAANVINNWSILSLGRIVGGLVSECHATGGVAAPYDTHACAEDVTFVDCSAEGVGAAPFALRGRNIHVVRPKVRSSSGGVLAFTEYDNNDPNDDIYNNGKTVADFTSVVIDSPDIECTGDAIVASAASVEMVGRGRIRSTSHRFITLNGGALAVYNHQGLVAEGGAAPNATACITVTPAAAAALSAFPTSTVTLNRGAALDIDARDSTSTLPDLISAASGTKVLVEGLLRARMPNIIGMALARVECSGPGVIEYSLANSVTIADLALTGLPVRLKDITTGEQFNGTGDTDFYHGYVKRLAVTADGISVSGNVYSAGLLAGTAPLANRATAAAATIPLDQQVISYRGPNGSLLQFVRDASGTALTTAGGATWSPLGDVTPEHWADAPTAESLVAMLAYASLTGRRGVVVGTYDISGAEIVDDTGGLIDWSAAVLITTAAGQADPEFRIGPVAGDLVQADAALLAIVQEIVTSGQWVRGARTFAALGAYAGQAVRIASTEAYIARYASASSHRIEVYVVVADAEGNLTAPLPFSVPSSVTLTVADREILRAPLEVRAPQVVVSSGYTDRGAVIRVNRSNTILIGGGISNTTTACLTIAARVNAFACVTLRDLVIQGAHEASANYGVSWGGVGHVVEDSVIRDCRRSIDGTYASHCVVRGGQYPDGIGGHLIHGLTICGGAVVACDPPNEAPIHMTGGDLTIADCTLSRNGSGPIINQRSDGPEIIGSVIMRGCRISVDLAGLSGNQAVPAVLLDWPAATYDAGRDVVFPESVIVEGNHWSFVGSGCTPRPSPLSVTSTRNAGRSIVLDTDVIWRANTMGGLSAEVRPSGVRKPNWTGAGIRFALDGIREMSAYWASEAGHAAPTAARASWTGQNIGNVSSFETDWEATKDYLFSCDTFIRATAAGLTAAVGDEQQWVSIKGGAPWRSLPYTADDAVTVLQPWGNYDVYLLIERGAAGSGRAAEFIIDAIGSDGVTILWSKGSTVFAASGAVLSGTTGVDGQITIGANSTTGKMYVENRTGSPLSGWGLVRVAGL